jgi:hypothetical protein
MRIPKLLAFALATFVAALTVSCDAGDPAAPAVAAQADRGGSPGHGAFHPGHGGGNKRLGVVTYNLYLGADIARIAAGDPPAALFATVQQTDFATRAVAIAREIAELRPALVGLQEAYLWRLQVPGDGPPPIGTPATAPVIDQLALLLAALEAEGLRYDVAAVQPQVDVELPVAEVGGDLRITDRDALLVRRDVRWQDARGGSFQAKVPFPVPGLGTLEVPRGWTAVDVKFRGEWLTFATTHLEAFSQLVADLQATELAALLPSSGRVVLTGDLNFASAAAILEAAGYRDLWARVNPDDPGFTCCQLEDLSNAESLLDERIDFIMYRGGIQGRGAELLGDEPGDRIDGLWPSDHAGVFGLLRLVDPKFMR